MSLVIQPTAAVRRDFLANRRWAFSCLGIIAGLVVVSAICFHYVEEGYIVDGKPHNGWLDSFYFTIINVTTVGFGDITPVSTLGKILAMFNSVLGVVSFGLLVAILTAALQPGEFTATATCGLNPIHPREPEGSVERQNTKERTAEDAVGLFLKGLGSLFGGGSVTKKHVKMCVHNTSDTGPKHVSIDIWVRID